MCLNCLVYSLKHHLHFMTNNKNVVAVRLFKHKINIKQWKRNWRWTDAVNIWMMIMMITIINCGCHCLHKKRLMFSQVCFNLKTKRQIVNKKALNWTTTTKKRLFSNSPCFIAYIKLIMWLVRIIFFFLNKSNNINVINN